MFSATLTSFLIHTKQNLQASPADKAVYYLEQNAVMLNQISRQLASIGPQVVIPSDPPSPYPTFQALSSAIRVNAFWFIALVFSLSAALLAILVRQWVRDYMHVFQRYSHPLKRARLRQYLHDGSYGWYMPVMAEAVPGFVHVSLFLFFIGLGDFALGIDTTVGINTLIPITPDGATTLASARFAPWKWTRIHRRDFLPRPQTTTINILVDKRALHRTFHRHFQGYHIQLGNVKVFLRDATSAAQPRLRFGPARPWHLLRLRLSALHYRRAPRTAGKYARGRERLAY